MPAAWSPPSGTSPPTFQILARVPQRGRGRSLGSKVGKGNGGRRGGEGGVWLSKVLNLAPKLGSANREFPLSQGPSPPLLAHLPQTLTRHDLGARDLNPN